MDNRHIEKRIYDFIKQFTPMACVDIGVICDNKILLLCRKIEPAQGYWALPRGHIQLGETVEDTALIELEEETGIIIKSHVLEYCGVVTYMFVDRQDITNVMLAELDTKPSEIKINNESASFGWYSFDKLPYPILETTRNEINLIFKRSKNHA